MTATGDEKSVQKKHIEAMESELSGTLKDKSSDDKSVDWRVRFAEVFDRREGFDVVIANPPYRRQEGLASRKKDLARLYPDVYVSTADYHVYFYNRAVQLLRDGGELAFITSNKYMRARYGRKIRSYLPKSLTLRHVVDFGDLPVFTAASYPAILVGAKDAHDPDHRLRVADLAMPVRRALTQQGLAVNRETVTRAMDALPRLLIDHGSPDYPQVLLRKNGWILEDPRQLKLFERLMSQGTPLGEFVQGRIYRGVLTGLNEAFVIDEAKKQDLIDADPRSAELIKPWLRGRDIKRWMAEHSEYYLIFTRRGTKIARYPAIRAHLEMFRHPTQGRGGKRIKGLEPRGGREYRKRGEYEWYEIQDTIAYYHEFAEPKVIFNRFINVPSFVYDSTGAWHNDACYMVCSPSPALAAILNSRLLWWLLGHRCTMLQNGYLQVFVQFLEPLPIQPMSASTGRRLSELVSDLARDPGDSDAEKEVEHLVRQSYGVNVDEGRAVDDWYERREQIYVNSAVSAAS